MVKVRAITKTSEMMPCFGLQDCIVCLIRIGLFLFIPYYETILLLVGLDRIQVHIIYLDMS